MARGAKARHARCCCWPRTGRRRTTWCAAVAAARGALFAVHRLTLNRLIGLLAADDLAARGLVPLSRLATEAVAARAIHRLYSPLLSNGAAQTARCVIFSRRSRRGRDFPVRSPKPPSKIRLAGVDSSALAGLERIGPPLAAILEQFERELAAASPDRSRRTDPDCDRGNQRASPGLLACRHYSLTSRSPARPSAT